MNLIGVDDVVRCAVLGLRRQGQPIYRGEVAGDCLDASVRLVLQRGPGAHLAGGLVRTDRRTLRHCWVEHDGRALDHSLSQRIELDAVHYRRHFGATQVRRLSHDLVVEILQLVDRRDNEEIELYPLWRRLHPGNTRRWRR